MPTSSVSKLIFGVVGLFLCLSAVADELPFSGTWTGEGQHWINNERHEHDSLLTVHQGQLFTELSSGEYRSLAVDTFSEDKNGALAWHDPKGNRIGEGYCDESVCTFVGKIQNGEIAYSKTLTIFHSKDRLSISETTTSTDHKYVRHTRYFRN